MLPSASDIIRRSVDLFKIHWRSYISYTIWMILIVVALGLIGGGAAIGAQQFGGDFLIPLIAIIAIAIGVLASLWVSVGLIRTIGADLTGSAHKPMREVLHNAKHLVLPFLGVSILTALAVLGGTILFIIPGIIFAVWFALSTYAVVLDEKGPIEAMKFSKSLVSRRWWNTLWLLVGPALFFMIISWIGQWIVMLPGSITEMTSLVLVGSILSVAVSIVITPLQTIAPTILYLDLKKTPVQQQAAHGTQSPQQQ